MLAGNLINPIIPPLKLSDKLSKVLSWLDELRLNQLPVVDKGVYLGIISDEMIYDLNDTSLLIEDVLLDYQDVFLKEDQHFYEVVKMATDYGVEIVPILSLDDKFLGVVSVGDTVSALARSHATQAQGGILVLSMDFRDYTLAEISRIIESENGKILSSYIETDIEDAQKIRLTIKVNKTDLSTIKTALRRFGYNIFAQFQDADLYDDDKNRLGILFNYLDV